MEKQSDVRSFRCAFCRCDVVICCDCDRGQRYCSTDCAAGARRAKLKRYARRYRQTPRGRELNAERQARWRRRKGAQRNASVTHHQQAAVSRSCERLSVHGGKRVAGPASTVLRKRSEFTPACCFCRAGIRSVGEWLAVAGEWILSRLRAAISRTFGEQIRRGEQRGSESAVDDIVQDAVTTVLTRVGGERSELDDVCATLFAHARNHCRNAWRKACRRQVLGFLG